MNGFYSTPLKPEYTDYVKKLFAKSPVLAQAEKIFSDKNETLTLDEYKNILMNVYLLSRYEIEVEEYNL